MGLRVQRLDGSAAVHTAQASGVQAGATWIVGEGSEKGGKHTKSIPIEKAMDDVLVAYGQNGEALRPQQGYRCVCSSRWKASTM